MLFKTAQLWCFKQFKKKQTGLHRYLLKELARADEKQVQKYLKHSKIPKNIFNLNI